MSANILPGALPTRIKVAHGVGAVTLGIKESGLTTFFMIYYNQVLGFDPRVVSLVLIGAMVVDAIVDPMIGRLSDATRTRLGRRLPWLYGAALPMAIVWTLLWVSPDIAKHSTLGLFLNVVAVRILVSACEIPSISLVAELTRDYDERTALMRYRFLFGWLGGLLAVALAYNVFLVSDDPARSGLLETSGYTAYGLFGAAMILLTTLASAFGQQRRILSLPPPPRRPHGHSMLADILLAFRNPAFLALASGALFVTGAYATTIASTNYMMLYVWQLSDAQLRFYPVGLAVAVFGAFAAVGHAHRRFGKRDSAIGAALAECGTVPAYWIDLGNRASDVQYLIGSPEHCSNKHRHRLPTVFEYFPELADENLPDDDAPSCSVAEALERQSLFVNRVLASHALALLFDLFGRGSIGHAGAFLNLASGQAVPIPLPRAA